jgi:hypothetical protein
MKINRKDVNAMRLKDQFYGPQSFGGGWRPSRAEVFEASTPSWITISTLIVIGSVGVEWQHPANDMEASNKYDQSQII